MDGQVVTFLTLGYSGLHTCESLNMRTLTYTSHPCVKMCLLKYPSIVQFSTVKRFVKKLNRILKYCIWGMKGFLHNGWQFE